MSTYVFQDALVKDVSAISITPLNPAHKTSALVLVAGWAGRTVEVLQQTDALRTVATSPAHSAPPRALLLYDFGRGGGADGPRPHLLVALADGTVAAYAFDRKTHALGEPRTFALGGPPAALAPAPRAGRPAVCAAGTRPGLLFFDQGRLQLAPLLAHVRARPAVCAEAANNLLTGCDGGRARVPGGRAAWGRACRRECGPAHSRHTRPA
jgi:hypothetical protein